MNKMLKKLKAYTLAEVVIVMLVIAVVAGVSIKITKAKLDNIISYTYYMGYSTLRNVTGQMLGDFKSTDDDYIETTNSFKQFFAFAERNILPLNLFSKIAKADDTPYRVCPYEIISGYREDSSGFSWPLGFGIYWDTNNMWDKPGTCTLNSDNYTCSCTYRDGGLKPCGTNYMGDQTYTFGSCNTRCLNIGGYNSQGRYVCSNGSGAYTANSPADCKDGYNVTYDPQNCGEYIDRMMYYCPSGYSGANGYPSGMSVQACTKDSTPTPTPSEPETCTEPSQATKDAQYCQGKEWSSEICNWKDITPWPPCNQEGSRWSQTSCACVPETATLPRKGANFCEKFLDYTNTKSTAEECNGDAIASNLTDFTDKKADIVLRNGLKLYNVRQNPAPLPLLAGNNQGGSYELADGTTVNVNEFGYTVYLDIDGEKGSSTLWEDVFPFYITMAGKVIPLYHTEGEKEYGGTSRQHLMTSVQKEVITTTGHRQVLWIRKSVPFKESACTSGYINSTTPYCSGVSLEPTCNEGANVCILKYVSPVKFF